MARVYSTEHGRLCPDCEQPIGQCQCRSRQAAAPTGDGIVRLERLRRGRGGKTVTRITGLALDEDELKALARQLKQLLGTGGAVREGAIEIQGDRRPQLREELERLGHVVRLSGG